MEKAGRVHLANFSMEALREAQAAFAGEADRLGLETEEDAVALVREIRKEEKVANKNDSQSLYFNLELCTR